MSNLKPGSLAVIRVTEWPRNQNRVVRLIHQITESTGEGWAVECVNGGTFDGYEVYAHDMTKGTGSPLEAKTLGIARWKLSPFNGEPTATFDGLQYVVDVTV